LELLSEALNIYKRSKKREKLREELKKLSAQLPTLIAQNGLIAVVSYFLEKSEVFANSEKIRTNDEKLAYLVSIGPILRIVAIEEEREGNAKPIEELLDMLQYNNGKELRNSIREIFELLLNISEKPVSYSKIENLALQYAIYLKRVFEAGGEEA